MLGGCIANDPRKYSIECEVVWMSGFSESGNQQNRRSSGRPVLNWHVLNMWIAPLRTTNVCTKEETTDFYRCAVEIKMKGLV